MLSAVTLVVAALFAFTAVARGNGDTLITLSIPAAFFGGVLSILSPCSAALLPAFFAISFRERTELVKMTTLFWLGITTIFIPLGFGTSIITKTFTTHQAAFFVGAGLLFIAFGLWSFIGPLFFPGTGAHLKHFGKGPYGVYAMGIAYSFSAGTCAAPVIGAIFTLAAAQGNAWYAFLLLFVYSLGLVVPLFFLAYFFDKKQIMSHPIIRGKLFVWQIRHRTFALHSTDMLTGGLFFLLAFLFLHSHGSFEMTGLFNKLGLTDLYFRLNEFLVTH